MKRPRKRPTSWRSSSSDATAWAIVPTGHCRLSALPLPGNREYGRPIVGRHGHGPGRRRRHGHQRRHGHGRLQFGGALRRRPRPSAQASGERPIAGLRKGPARRRHDTRRASDPDARAGDGLAAGQAAGHEQRASRSRPAIAARWDSISAASPRKPAKAAGTAFTAETQSTEETSIMRKLRATFRRRLVRISRCTAILSAAAAACTAPTPGNRAASRTA